MKRMQIRLLLGVIILIISLASGCTLPGFSTPTPFTFPTPDQTMTALFEPTSEAPATSAGSGVEGEGDPSSFTATPEPATDTPVVAATETPTATGDLTPTSSPTYPIGGPEIRGGPSVSATKLSKKPSIDGDLYEWDTDIQKVIKYVVYGANNWTGEADASGTVVIGWDNDFLYLGFRVKDDKYVQKATGKEIYLGDSVEVLFDADVSGDYFSEEMNSDDYQIGISPGKNAFAYVINNGKVASFVHLIHTDTPDPCATACPTDTPKPTSKPACTNCDPQAYVWFPPSEAGKNSDIKIGVLESGKGYQVEVKIPWDLLNVNPQKGDHYGLALSISDNDKSGAKEQQTMVSNVSTRYYANPTTWGDLILE